jgi:WhiB family redox-sensing transcriptional regulator
MNTSTEQEWRQHAACLGMPVNLFFPMGGVPDQKVIAICKGCSVKTECLNFALSHDRNEDQTGVFGGTTARQRIRIRQTIRAVGVNKIQEAIDAHVPKPPRKRKYRSKKPIQRTLYWDAEKGKYRTVSLRTPPQQTPQ